MDHTHKSQRGRRAQDPLDLRVVPVLQSYHINTLIETLELIKDAKHFVSHLYMRLSECQRSGQCVFSKQLLLKS